MRLFVATVETEYLWKCPYCKGLMRTRNNPLEVKILRCGFCGEESECVEISEW